MPTIEISQETFEALKRLAEPLVDSPDTVIRRLVEAYEGPEPLRTEEIVHRAVEEATVERHDGKRARKGQKTSHEEFYEPLLQVLREAGGQLPAGAAIDLVGERMKQVLKPVDLARLPSGEVRWRNTVRWARHRLAEQGRILKGAPHGFWVLADFDDPFLDGQGRPL